MSELLRQQATNSFRWTAGAHGIRQVVQLATLAGLARLLDPSDFGLMAMAMVFIGFAQLFHDLGTGSAIIQRAEVSQRLLVSMFWVNIACGIGAFIITLASAPLVASFFGEPRLHGLLQFVALTFLVSSPGVVPKALLRRELKFKTLARVDTAAMMIGASAALLAAWRGAGVYALGAQALAGATSLTALMLISARFVPKLQFCLHEVRQVAGFSFNLTAFNICNHVTRQADYLIIGKLAGAEALGFYTIAYQLILYPLRHVSGVINRVAYPVYARLQHDPRRLRRAFCRSSANVATITLPILAGMAVAALPITRAIFGERWDPSATLLTLLVPVGCLQALVTTFGSIYHVTNRNGLLLVWSAIIGIVILVALIIGAQWGAVGVAAAYSIATLAVLYPCMRVPFGLIDLRIAEFARELWRPALCAVLMAAAVLIARIAVSQLLEPAAMLALLVVVGGAVYAVLTWSLNRQRLFELFEVAFPPARLGLG